MSGSNQHGVRESRGRFFVRVRFGKGRRAESLLRTCLSLDAAVGRAKWISVVVDELRAAGLDDMVRDVVRRAARVTDAGLSSVRSIVADLTIQGSSLLATAPLSTALAMASMRAPAKEGRSLVYFIQDFEGHIKIGHAADVYTRLAIIQNGHARAVRLLGVEAGGAARERALHARFRNARLRGEWFRPTIELTEYVIALRAEEAVSA